MHKADTAITTPPRRFVLRFGAATTVAGLLAPTALAAVRTAGADARLIAACNRLLNLQMEMEALHAIRHTLADETRTQPALERLYQEEEIALGRIDDIGGPTTLAGARAMAEASLASAPRDSAGDLLFQGNAEWLAFCVAEFLVERIGT